MGVVIEKHIALNIEFEPLTVLCEWLLLMMDHVILEPYSRKWALMFLKEKILLRFFLFKPLVDVQYIGSTSVPGMIARPVVDILAAVSDFEAAFGYIQCIEWLGYEFQGANSDLHQYYFTKGIPAGYHLCLVELGNQTWNERIAFRDLLLENPHLAIEYADYKQQLSLQFSTDLDAYQNKKGEYVRSILGSISG